jgi:hypothetical protein
MKLGISQIKPSQIIHFDIEQIIMKKQLYNKYKEDIIFKTSHFDEKLLSNYLSQFTSLYCNKLDDFVKCIPEDICVMKKINGEYILVACLVGFPNRWRPKEKIGNNIDFIHSSVPNFDKNKVEMFFDLMKENQYYRRSNWGVVETSELYLPYNKNGYGLYFREEIQTFLKYKDFIIFLIYTKITPIINQHSKTKLLNLISSLSEKEKLYKDISPQLLSKL